MVGWVCTTAEANYCEGVMNKISEERLKVIFGSDSCVTLEESAAMAGELLERRERDKQPPVAYRKLIKDEWNSDLDYYQYFEYQGIGGLRQPLYAAPPPPQNPPKPFLWYGTISMNVYGSQDGDESRIPLYKESPQGEYDK